MLTVFKKIKNFKLIFTFYIFIIIIIRNIVYLISVFLPLNRNNILIKSYNGDILTCNPKYIFKHLYSRFGKNLNFVIVSNDKRIESKNIKYVKYKGCKFYWYYLTSKFIVVNDVFEFYIPKRRKQIYINTWHGGGAYKKVGYSLTINKDSLKSLYYKWAHNCSYMISSSQKTTEAFVESFDVSKSKILKIGMPRNDIFFYKDLVEQANNEVRAKYKINKDELLILYAPTWRDDNRKIINNIANKNVLLSLEKYYNKKVRLMIRAHYNTSNFLLNENCINVTDYPDMQELLCAADVLITDYSSCMWDFSLLYKPCFIYATDIEQYKQERDFYTPMSTWPFPIATSANELIYNIINFSNDKYIKNVKKHHQSLGSYEDGHACEHVCKLIDKIIEKG